MPNEFCHKFKINWMEGSKMALETNVLEPLDILELNKPKPKPKPKSK